MARSLEADAGCCRPLRARQVHKYALELANRIATRDPAKYTTVAGAGNRTGKLFLDCLRNGRGYTAVGAYSPRARNGLPVAYPTTWEEIEHGTRSDAFAVNAIQRKKSWA
jgi:bifunctional non-homologous end joining protein LigD